MEIDITDFVTKARMETLSGSQAEFGPDAGRITWANSVKAAETTTYLKSPADFEKFRAWVRDFGAWSACQIRAWSDQHCNAILLQHIAGHWRVLQASCSTPDGEIDWRKAHQLGTEGRVASDIYKGDVIGSTGYGRVFFYMGG